jgi:hypothetical protein
VPRGANLQNPPDRLRCVATTGPRSKQPGTRCPNHRVHGHDKCSFHLYIPQRLARRDPDPIRALETIPDEAEDVKAEERARVIEEQLRRAEARAELRDRQGERPEPEKVTGLGTMDTKELARLNKLIADPETPSFALEALRGKRDDILSGKYDNPERTYLPNTYTLEEWSRDINRDINRPVPPPSRRRHRQPGRWVQREVGPPEYIAFGNERHE